MILGLDAAMRTAARLALLHPDPTVQIAHLCLRPRTICPEETEGLRAYPIAKAMLEFILRKTVRERCLLCDQEDLDTPNRSLS